MAQAFFEENFHVNEGLLVDQGDEYVCKGKDSTPPNHIKTRRSFQRRNSKCGSMFFQEGLKVNDVASLIDLTSQDPNRVYQNEARRKEQKKHKYIISPPFNNIKLRKSIAHLSAQDPSSDLISFSKSKASVFEDSMCFKENVDFVQKVDKKGLPSVRNLSQTNCSKKSVYKRRNSKCASMFSQETLNLDGNTLFENLYNQRSDSFFLTNRHVEKNTSDDSLIHQSKKSRKCSSSN